MPGRRIHDDRPFKDAGALRRDERQRVCGWFLRWALVRLRQPELYNAIDLKVAETVQELVREIGGPGVQIPNCLLRTDPEKLERKLHERKLSAKRMRAWRAKTKVLVEETES